MSNILGAGTIGGVEHAVEHPQLPAGTSAIGLTYIPSSEKSTLRGMLDEAETQVILCALQHTRWNRKRAAALLKISYRGLLYKIRRHRITPPMAETE
jgi:DNA-binding NtrC family response regulator